jgi:hypothetical protein
MNRLHFRPSTHGIETAATDGMVPAASKDPEIPDAMRI